MTIPDLLPPATERNPLLVIFNRLGTLTETLIGLCEVEVGADIGRLLSELGQQQPLVALELVCLAATVVSVINPDLVHVKGPLVRPVPVFVGCADAPPRLVQAQQTSVRIVERAGLLNQTIPLFVQGLFRKRGGRLELHVCVNRKRIGGRGIPAEGDTKELRVLKGKGAIHTEIRPRMLVVFGGDRKGGEKGVEDGKGVVGGARIGNADCIGQGEGGCNGALDNARLIFNHEQENHLFVGHGAT